MEQMFEVTRLHTVLEIVRRPILQGGPKGAQTEKNCIGVLFSGNTI
jgi:hypothetical protein